MLKKIFKYEWKTICPLLLAVHGVGLVIAVICRIGIRLMDGLDGNDNSLMAILLMMAAVMAIGCIVAYTYFYTGYRFYKSVFTQQGYLTNTLPVTADQLIWGKGFTAVIWVSLNFLWAVIALIILIASPSDVSEILHELPKAIASLFSRDTPAFVWLAVLSTLLTPFSMTIQIYASAAIGNLFMGHKLLATIGSFFGISFIQQILGLVILAICGPHLTRITYQAQEIEGNISYYTPVLNTMNLMMILTLAFSVICAVGFYFLCRYVLDHKLNLE